MKDIFKDKTNKQLVIEYFEKKLVANNGFKKTGGSTFYYKDKIDTIFVYVTDANITVISDGKDVVDGMFMLRLYDIHSSGYESYEELHECFNHSYLQQILHLF